MKLPVVRSADRLPEHNLAIDHDDQRALILERGGVDAHSEVVDGDAILAVGGKVVSETDAATRAQRQRHVRVGIGGDGVFRTRHRWIGIADRELRDLPRGGDVLAQEGGRHGQRRRDVVEAVDLAVLRQHVRRFQLHTHQRLHRRDVLRAVQPLDRNMARLRSLGLRVERVLHPADERIHILLRRLRTAGRRHQMSAQLAQRLLPDLRVIRCGLEVQAVQREAADLRAAVVAADAVGIQHRLMWSHLGRCRRSSGSLSRGSGLQECRRGDQSQNSTCVKETLHGFLLGRDTLGDLHLGSPWVGNERDAHRADEVARRLAPE